jgi:ketopantoate reductase
MKTRIGILGMGGVGGYFGGLLKRMKALTRRNYFT